MRPYRERFDLSLCPDTPEVLAMLQELSSAFPGSLPILMGCPGRTIKRWLAYEAAPPLPAARLVWLTWCITLHPERIQSIADLITWGYAHTTHAKKKYGRHPKG